MLQQCIYLLGCLSLIVALGILWGISILLLQSWEYHLMATDCTWNDIFVEGNCRNGEVDVVKLTLLVLLYCSWLLYFTRQVYLHLLP